MSKVYVTSGGWRARAVLAVGRVLGLRGDRAVEVLDRDNVVALAPLHPPLGSPSLLDWQLRAIRREPPQVRQALLEALVYRALGYRGDPDPTLPRLSPEEAEAARRGEDVEL